MKLKQSFQVFLSESKKLTSLAIPIIIGQVGQILINLTDNLMIGKLGSLPLAATAFTNGVFSIVLMFGLGVSSAITPLTATAQGSGDPRKCGEILKHGLMINVSVALLLIGLLHVISLFFGEFGQDPRVVVLSKQYFYLITWSLLPTMVFQSFRQFFDGLSRTTLPMLLMLFGVVANFAGNYVFIFGHYGFPELGIMGSGFATFSARLAMALLIMLMAFKLKGLRELLPLHWLKDLQRSLFAELLKLGVPTGFMWVFEVGAFAMTAIMMGWISADAQAAHQIAISLASTTFMISVGLAISGNIRVAFEAGREDFAAVRRVGFTCITVATLYMFVTATAFMLGRNFWPQLYVKDPQVLAIASQILMVAGVFQISDGIQVVSINILRGLKDVKFPFVLTFIAYWVVALPVGYFFGVHFMQSPNNLWWALCLGLTIVAILLPWRFHRLSKSMQINSHSISHEIEI